MGIPQRIATPVVLALASAMVSVGFLAMSKRRFARPDHRASDPPAAEVDVRTRTPQQVAESFLDAWRKRNHPVAEQLAVGVALDEVEARRRQDATVTDPARNATEQVWQALAAHRLAFRVESREEKNGDHLLQGQAEGEFMGRPYRRKVAFLMRQSAAGWRVAQMALGAQISEAPDFLQDEPLNPTGANTPAATRDP